VVLTGGANLMEGMVECAEEVLGMPVRVGFPMGITGLTQLVQGPQYAASVGLLHYAARQIAEAEARAEHVHVTRAVSQPAASQIGRGLIGWLRGAF
jgi:cell division protein FtsA